VTSHRTLVCNARVLVYSTRNLGFFGRKTIAAVGAARSKQKPLQVTTMTSTTTQTRRQTDRRTDRLALTLNATSLCGGSSTAEPFNYVITVHGGRLSACDTWCLQYCIVEKIEQFDWQVTTDEVLQSPTKHEHLSRYTIKRLEFVCMGLHFKFSFYFFVYFTVSVRMFVVVFMFLFRRRLLVLSVEPRPSSSGIQSVLTMSCACLWANKSID